MGIFAKDNLFFNAINILRTGRLLNINDRSLGGLEVGNPSVCLNWYNENERDKPYQLMLVIKCGIALILPFRYLYYTII